MSSNINIYRRHKRFGKQSRWRDDHCKFFLQKLLNPKLSSQHKLIILACSIWGVLNIANIPNESHIWLKLSLANIILDSIEITNVDMRIINWYLKKFPESSLTSTTTYL